MKAVSKILVILVVVLAVAIPLMAQDASPAASGSGVNIRSGPSIEYSLRGALVTGSLTITGRNEFDASRVCTGINSLDLDMWLRVDVSHIEGWVARCAVNVTGDVSSLPVVTASDPVLISDLNFDPIGEKPLGDTSVEDFVYGVTRAQVNMRENPGLGSTILSTLRAGELVYVIGVNGDASWVQVEVDGASGWVARYLMSLPHDWQATLNG